jgi:uncharacterized protein YbjT (DUF2867 family)
MPQAVLVLGATGTTGRRLVPKLVAQGVTVRAASRQPAEGFLLFDWNAPDTHSPALEGVDGVYLLATAMVENPADITGPFLELAKRTGVQKVVVLSSMAAQFPNGEQLGAYKLEQQIMTSGLEWTLLRPGFFSQNLSEGFLLPGIVHADTIATATGDGAVAFIDADDIAAVAAAALTQPGHTGKAYVITGPEALTLNDAAAIISDAAGRPISNRAISADELTRILLDAGLPADYAANLIFGSQFAIRDGFASTVTDVVARVGGRPPTRFVDFAARAAAA